MNRKLIVIPTYNERECIAVILEKILSFAPDADALVIDDASPDGTADLVERLFVRYSNVAVRRREGPRGLGRSYREAFGIALDSGYSLVAQMDADLSHDPADLPALFRAAEAAEVVIGSRYVSGGGVRNWPLKRRLLSRLGNLYFRLALSLPVHDATSGFRCYQREALEAIRSERTVSSGFAFQAEMTYLARRAGLKIAEMPILFVERREGASKMSAEIVREALSLPARLRFGGDSSSRNGESHAESLRSRVDERSSRAASTTAKTGEGRPPRPSPER